MNELFLPDHPDAPAEAAHLHDTVAIIDRELAALEKETGVRAGEERVVAVPRDATMDEIVAADIFRMKLDALRALGFARRQAYFAHLDFIPAGGGAETHYLGRWGVTTTDTLDTVVVDWRSPVANLYYAGQLGPVSYEAPDGTVAGELTLKRLLTVHGEQPEGIFDSGIVSQDAYLQSVLGQVTGDRLKEIVTTIQAEQNLVIRHPVRKTLIVQGVAGSGKTTIALHRIAYLLYANRKTLRPEQLMILAPNPLFLDYISQVLPDLGVERVMQTTFHGMCVQLLGKALPKAESSSRLEDKLLMTAQQREQMGRVLRRKGSLAFKQSLEDYLELRQGELPPEKGLVFGNVLLMRPEDVRQVFLTQLKHFPFRVRIEEMKKYVRSRLNAACAQMKAQLEKMASARLDALLSSLPDGPERRAKATRLLDSRDARLQEVDERAKAYLKDFPSLWPSLSLSDVYADYLRRCEEEEVCEATLPLLEKGRCRMEDLPALVVLGRAVCGVKKLGIRHVVVDECQDFSPFQVALLRELTADASFTLVGDLQQGVHEEEGIRSFDEWVGPVFGGAAEVKLLVTSYRSTVEIMELAGAVSARHPVPGQLQARPVLRHGQRPQELCCETDKALQASLAAQLATWRAEGFSTMAVIARTAAGAAALHKALKKTLPVQLLKEGDASYAGGMVVLPASLVKGLEFDCVAVCGVDDAEWPDDPFLSRVLYVCLTRPLHRLLLAHTGTLTPLIPKEALLDEQTA